MTLVVFIAGFLIETTGSPKFFLTAKFTFLLGILPFVAFNLRNFPRIFDRATPNLPQSSTNQGAYEHKIHLVSKLKSEKLSFHPSELVYAESVGNYATFHFDGGEHNGTAFIRNSISDIEWQLAPYAIFLRTHRGFIVNMERVSDKAGNALGYRLKLRGTDQEIPVSRQNIRRFDDYIPPPPTSRSVVNA